MDRRGFLQFIGAFAIGAALPSFVIEGGVVRAPSWWKGPVTVFKVNTPLEAGFYTFTANAGELGMYVGGVAAKGGESYFELPLEKWKYADPRLIKGGLVYELREGWLSAETMLAGKRGPKVSRV